MRLVVWAETDRCAAAQQRLRTKSTIDEPDHQHVERGQAAMHQHLVDHHLEEQRRDQRQTAGGRQSTSTSPSTFENRFTTGMNQRSPKRATWPGSRSRLATSTTRRSIRLELLQAPGPGGPPAWPTSTPVSIKRPITKKLPVTMPRDHRQRQRGHTLDGGFADAGLQALRAGDTHQIVSAGQLAMGQVFAARAIRIERFRRQGQHQPKAAEPGVRGQRRRRRADSHASYPGHYQSSFNSDVIRQLSKRVDRGTMQPTGCIYACLSAYNDDRRQTRSLPFGRCRREVGIISTALW